MFAQRWPQGLVCPACGHRRHGHRHGRDVFQRHRGKHPTSLPPGTVLAEAKLPLRTWFLAMSLGVQVAPLDEGMPFRQCRQFRGISARRLPIGQDHHLVLGPGQSNVEQAALLFVLVCELGQDEVQQRLR
ncbi:hypothetical protein [Xanthomonas theicola]|uniref:hypothetical protein n=1 Tax=Xanthomonas theicola TaxID=56464 RepID=UPI003CCE01ED